MRGEAGGESGLGNGHRMWHSKSVRLRVHSKSTVWEPLQRRWELAATWPAAAGSPA
jgi:hypothetical protein